VKVEEFMKLPDSEKVKCENRVDYDTIFDIATFTLNEVMSYGFECEACGVKNEKMIGTSDIREPKFCFKHYAEQNKDSAFVQVKN